MFLCTVIFILSIFAFHNNIATKIPEAFACAKFSSGCRNSVFALGFCFFFCHLCIHSIFPGTCNYLGLRCINFQIHNLHYITTNQGQWRFGGEQDGLKMFKRTAYWLARPHGRIFTANVALFRQLSIFYNATWDQPVHKVICWSEISLPSMWPSMDKELYKFIFLLAF